MKNNIKRYREKSGLSQLALAEKLGISQQAIASWETGTKRPSTENLFSLSAALGCKADDLFTNEGEGDGNVKQAIS